MTGQGSDTAPLNVQDLLSKSEFYDETILSKIGTVLLNSCQIITMRTFHMYMSRFNCACLLGTASRFMLSYIKLTQT